MVLALTLTALLAAPASAQKHVVDVECELELGAYLKAPNVATVEPMLHCYEAYAGKTGRVNILKHLPTRQIWDDPRMEKEGYPRLKAFLAAERRSKDYDIKWAADSDDWWLHNYETYRDEKARAREQIRLSGPPETGDEIDRIRLSFIFGAGIVLQLLFFLSNAQTPDRLSKLVGAMAFGLIGLMPGKHEHNYELHFHICYCFILFAFFTFTLFKADILARINESSLLINSLIFWYLFLSYFDHLAGEKVFMAIAAAPTVLTLVVAFTLRDWSFTEKFACYVWFLILVLVISIFQVRFGDLAFVWTSRYAAPKPFNLFLTGMAFTYLAASVFYLYILIPIAGKHETQEHRMIQWHEDAEMMASDFADYEMPPAAAAIIVAVQGGLYAGNYLYRWLPVPVMVNLSLIAMPIAFRALFALFNKAAGAAKA